MTGKFIALEGPDGSGKSTMMKLIEKYFNENDIEYISTREPGGTHIGEKIRKIVLDKDNTNMSAEAEALLYAAARAQHVHEKIVPALKQGKIVICDRFLLSSLAYQGVGRELGVENVKAINEFGLRGIYPDLILFFHVDPIMTLERKTRSKSVDRLELEGDIFHKKIYNGYIELIKNNPRNISIIDATKSIEEVFRQSINEIQSIL